MTQAATFSEVIGLEEEEGGVASSKSVTKYCIILPSGEKQRDEFSPIYA